MNKDRILKFLEKNDCKSKNETIKELIKNFGLDNKEAEEIYKAWKKEYMKVKVS